MPGLIRGKAFGRRFPLLTACQAAVLAIGSLICCFKDQKRAGAKRRPMNPRGRPPVMGHKNKQEQTGKNCRSRSVPVNQNEWPARNGRNQQGCGCNVNNVLVCRRVEASSQCEKDERRKNHCVRHGNEVKDVRIKTRRSALSHRLIGCGHHAHDYHDAPEESPRCPGVYEYSPGRRRLTRFTSPTLRSSRKIQLRAHE